MANSRKEISFFHGASTESSIGNSKRGSVSPEFPFFSLPLCQFPSLERPDLRNFEILSALPCRVGFLISLRVAGPVFSFPGATCIGLVLPTLSAPIIIISYRI
jgi:hypothetical protein